MSESTATLEAPAVVSGNAGDQPNANAIDQEVTDFLSLDKGSAAATPETQAEETSPPETDTDDVQAAIDRAADAKAEQKAQAKQDEAQKVAAEDKRRADEAAVQQQHRESYLAGMNVTPKAVGDYIVQQVNAGADPVAVATAVVDYVSKWANNHHGLGVQQYKPMAKIEAQAEQVDAFNTAIDGLLNAEQRREWRGQTYSSIEDAAKAAVATATKGMITKADAAAEYALKLSAYTEKLRKEGKLNGTSSVRQGGGGSATTGGIEPKTLREAEEMHAGLHASGRKITSDEMRSKYIPMFTTRKGT